jgi:ParB family transcriptional regulator, chromosome partitioning protein
MIEAKKQEVPAPSLIQIDAVSNWPGKMLDEGVFLLPADQIRIPDDPNRDESAFSGENFERLKDSIDATKGNTQPALVRKYIGKDGKVVNDLVCGYRRHRACLLTGWPVKVFVTEHSDNRALYLWRIAENALREDLSPYERGRQIDQGFVNELFKLESEAARLIGVDKSDLNKLRRLGRLDPRIVAAFASPSDLQFKHAKPLSDAVAANPDAVLAEADRIAALETKPSANEVVVLLVAAASVRGVGPSHTPTMDLPLGCDGQPVGRIKVAKNGTVKIDLDVPLERKQRELLAKTLETFVRKRVLKPAVAVTKPEARQ